MTRQLVDERPTTVDPQAVRRRSGDRRPMEWADLWNAFPAGTWVAAGAAVRGALVALSGMVVTVSLAIVVWAITPQSGDDASAALHAGFAALAAANLLPISIGGVSFTLPPLLITLLVGILLASSARRGRLLPDGRGQECLVILVGGGVYGLLVLMVTRGLGPDGVVAAGAGPLAVGILGYGIGTLARDSAWRSWWRSVVPSWLTLAVRAATVGSIALIGGAAAVLALSLGLHFGAALTVAAAVAPGGLDGAGLALLQLLYLPNAVLAAVGFSTGAGVQVGPGSYLPWGAAPAELPGVPLLAALPTGTGPSVVTAVLLVPVLAAGLLGWTVVRGGLATRVDRVLAAGTAAGLSALVLGVAAFAAGGGVGDGRWAVVGTPALLVAATVAVIFAAVGAAVAGLMDHRTVPWRAADPHARPATRRPRSDRAAETAEAADQADEAGAAEPDEASLREDPMDDAAEDAPVDENRDPRDAEGTAEADPTDDQVGSDQVDVDHATSDQVGSDQVDRGRAADAADGPQDAADDGEPTDSESTDGEVTDRQATGPQDSSTTDPTADPGVEVPSAAERDDENPGPARGASTA